MIINHKVNTLNFSDDMNTLICEIDTKLSTLSQDKLDSVRYGAKVCINWDTFDILVKYRKILLDKANNSFCLRSYPIDSMISNIKQYLSSGKVQKFKQITPVESNILSYSVTQNNIEVVVKNNYGNLTVNNNNSFPKVVEDEWDSIQW